MGVFFLFVFVSLLDLAFTIYGIHNGYITEKGFFINLFAGNSLFNIPQSIIIFKIVFIMVAYWLVNESQVRLRNFGERVTLKKWLEDETPKRVLLILVLITTFLGVLPSIMINIHYIFFFKK